MRFKAHEIYKLVIYTTNTKMTRIDVINRIIELSQKHKLTAKEVIKGAMKIWQFNELEADDIINLLNNKYGKEKSE